MIGLVTCPPIPSGRGCGARSQLRWLMVLVCFGVTSACGAAGQGSDSQQATDALNAGLDA
jgi:hypothetical protein